MNFSTYFIFFFTLYAKTRKLVVDEPRIGPMLISKFKEAVKDILDASGGDQVWERKFFHNFIECVS